MDTQETAGPHYTPGQTRSRPMEVLALGLPRTGTASMALALTHLGYAHVAHGMDLLDNSAWSARWLSAVNAKFFSFGKPFSRADWDELLGHCAAVTDMPCAAFWSELVQAYPEAKVVLVQREEGRWAESFNEGVVESMFSPSGTFVRKYVEPLLGSKTGEMSMRILQGWLGAQTEEGIKANAKDMCRRHYAEIRPKVPAQRMLEFWLEEGWEPLCAFLDKERSHSRGAACG